jgi:8-oxo-dGTP diphosphatase
LAIRLQPHIPPSVIHPAGRAHRSDENLAPFSDVHTERATPLIIVGAAIVVDGKVLGCERAEPPESAGRWEFPGGKVEPGESDIDALVRECEEELGVIIGVGTRVGGDVPLAHGRAVLRVWLSHIVQGVPQALEHASLRWLAPDEFDSVPWLPADAPIVAELARVLRPA